MVRKQWKTKVLSGIFYNYLTQINWIALKSHFLQKSKFTNLFIPSDSMRNLSVIKWILRFSQNDISAVFAL